MRRVVLFLALFVPVVVLAQVNHADSNGLRQGKWEKFYSNGQKMYEGQFLNGKPVGEWTRFHEGGQVKAKMNYVENSDSANTQLFDVWGKKVAEGVYLNEKREGRWIYYADGVKVAEEEFAHGVKHGGSKTYYPSGELLEESEWQNGVQQGNYSVFFKNGRPYMQCKFQNGKRNGLCLSYFQNGRVEMEAHYKNNLRNGEWKFNNEQGAYLYSLIYEEGRLLNPEVRDSIDNKQIQNLENTRHNIPDPEKFMQDPTQYMMEMQKNR
ncbi:Antitoxin component YwqK of the YwqJK toxin-antitoxin module [Mariniphaga anaerophila]|uniref:Antitoxin component YwqK of the YwqJK toxin-antitoxin module n=1 Tax=Mariniphaga anaerophila TaxID=1484053 RepID=A0A1M4W4Q8_9BACT|nr:toxin-antitoxin system YwqK family antitoxin [Mariniphaga anaerophila]SHE76093.1 Antitoxin component YwqK of the YwqJK toxin-antitoxin module [Mariniphaga anaerophila]